MPPVEEYSHIKEYNLENLIIKDRLTGLQQPFLLRPSFADPCGGAGYCLCLACSDVLNHRRRLHEFTRPASTAEFFGQIFSYSYSIDQLIKANMEQIDDVMKYVHGNGVSHTDYYNSAPFYQGTDTKALDGYPRLSIDGYKRISRNWILPEPQKTEELLRWIGEVRYELENFGPLVGCFSCQRDVSLIATEFLYDPSPSTRFMNVSHAVMLVGAGTAYHEPTEKWKSYSIFQNNWGENGNPIGRIPWEKIADVYSPTFKDQFSLVDYMDGQDEEAKWRYELRIDDQGVCPMEF